MNVVAGVGAGAKFKVNEGKDHSSYRFIHETATANVMYDAIADGMSSSAPPTAEQRGSAFKDESRNAYFFRALPARVYGWLRSTSTSIPASHLNELTSWLLTTPLPRCFRLPSFESQHQKRSLY